MDIDESIDTKTEAVGQTNIYKICFNNAYKFYMEEL